MPQNNSELMSENIYKKLDIIETISSLKSFTDGEISILDKLSRDEESEIRARVAEVLVISFDVSSEEILIRLLKDKDEIVRVNACDTLGCSKSPEILNLLKERVVKDKSSLVRGYASLSIADIGNRINLGNNLINFFYDVLKKEKVNWVKINIYRSMYKLGDESSLTQLLTGLNNRLYKNRSVTISCLIDIINPTNCSIIKPIIIKQLQVEKTVAVKSKLEKFLKQIEHCC